MSAIVVTKSNVECTFCGEKIPKGGSCYRWTGFIDGLITGTESAHPECYLIYGDEEQWRRGCFDRPRKEAQ